MCNKPISICSDTFGLSYQWISRDMNYKLISIRTQRLPTQTSLLLSVNDILSQPFDYLNQSSRAYVYVSSDHKYVIKTFKSAKDIEAQFRLWGMDLGTVAWSPKPGDALGAAKIMYQNTLRSYKLAYHTLQQETGLIYLHLKPTSDLIQSISINGTTYSPNTTKFLIQYNVQLLGDVMNEMMATRNETKAKNTIDELLSYIISLWKKKITEDTFNFHDNYGILNNKVIQIDVGEFHDDLQTVKREIAQKLIIKKESFAWLKSNHPTLADYLVEQVNKRFVLGDIVNDPL